MVTAICHFHLAGIALSFPLLSACVPLPLPTPLPSHAFSRYGLIAQASLRERK
ncbi:TPA: hypothetical protein SMN08_001328 [Proteus mirabilis]|nr:hypothetical protein [Proteus mirabilis]